jgi:hypothetical protein
MAVFRDVLPCGMGEIDRSFREAICLRHQGGSAFFAVLHLIALDAHLFPIQTHCRAAQAKKLFVLYFIKHSRYQINV